MAEEWQMGGRWVADKPNRTAPENPLHHFHVSFVMRRSQVRVPSPAPYKKPCKYRCIAGCTAFPFLFRMSKIPQKCTKISWLWVADGWQMGGKYSDITPLTF
jgi:hypothetical protein